MFVSSLLIAIGVDIPRVWKVSAELFPRPTYVFPTDIAVEFLGPEVLRVTDARFRAQAVQLAIKDDAEFDAIWSDAEWRALIRSDFERERCVLACGFVLSYTESVIYAAEFLRSGAIISS